MIGNSVPEYIFIRLCIAALRLVVPISILYLVTCIYYRVFLFTPILGSLAVAETLFYILVYLPRKRRLQGTPTYKPLALTSSQRKALFKRCTDDVGDLVQAEGPPYPRGWFQTQKTGFKSKLRRQDVIDWLLCALFSSSPEQMQEEWKEELDVYVAKAEQLLGESFGDTGDSGVKSMRVTIDEVKMVHRPLLWYLIVCLVDTLTCLRLFFCGFQHLSTHKWLEVFPPRPVLSLISRKASPALDVQLPYWYRPHKSLTKLPVMFLHGIGIGLHPYIPLFRDIVSLEPDIGILLVELLPISMHMTTHTVPPAPLIASALNDILDHHGIPRIILSAHSYSTFISSCILHDSFPAYNVPSPHPDDHPHGDTPLVPHPLLSKIAHIVLIDPIPILLHLPSVAYNFLYRSPSKAAEWQLWFFASMDPDVARSLGRSFFWTEGVAWKEDIRRWMHGSSPTERRLDGKQKKGRNMAIFLGGRDQIVPAETIRQYLTGEPQVSSRWVGRGWAYWDQTVSDDVATKDIPRMPEESNGSGTTFGDLEVLFNSKLDHATIFGAREREPLLDVFMRFINDQ